MKRRAFKLFLLLLAGAIINVAVAWGCLVFAIQDSRPRPMTLMQTPTDADLEWWRRCAPPGMVLPENAKQEDYCGVSIRNLNAQGILLNTGPPAIVGEQSRRYRTGWPWFAMGGDWFFYSDPHLAKKCETRSRGLLVFDQGHFTGLDEFAPHVPVRPLWPGFAINTIFYAAIVWFLFFAPGAIRKRVRRKRGQCAACGYSLQDISADKCPECGTIFPCESHH